jgi:hypothetical protein
LAVAAADVPQNAAIGSGSNDVLFEAKAAPFHLHREVKFLEQQQKRRLDNLQTNSDLGRGLRGSGCLERRLTYVHALNDSVAS